MIYFTRHGQTINNLEDRLQGVLDSPLTPLGLRQAEYLKSFAFENKVEKLVVSPLSRVVKTASIISLPYSIDTRLREICYGQWEGVKKLELKKLPLWKSREKDKFNFKHPGSFNGIAGESYNDLYLRLIPFLKEVLCFQDEVKLLIISHIGVLRCVSKFFNKISDKEAGNLNYNNETVLVLENGRIFEYKRLF